VTPECFQRQTTFIKTPVLNDCGHFSSQSRIQLLNHLFVTCSGLNSFENSLGPKLALFGFQWRCGVAAWLNKERVGAVLQRCVPGVVEGWLARAKQSHDLNRLLLSDEQRTGHLPRLVEDLARRLGQSSASAKDSDASPSPAAAAHGETRYRQGYTPAMLVHESRILEVTIFGTLQSNLNSLEFSLLLPDIMAIADEVDSQLTQSMESYMKLMWKSMAA